MMSGLLRRSIVSISATLVAISASVATYAQASPETATGATACSRFVGNVQAQWIDSRQMQLLAPFVFIDAACQRWDVPSGTRIDGASIPKALWSMIGGPFEGAYRAASVVHDHYCVTKSRSWQHVHRMFYEGMIVSGTDPLKAKIMYYAVLVGGPRWKEVTYSNHPPRMFPDPGDVDEAKLVSYSGSVTEAQMQARLGRIESENLSIADIERLATKDFNGREPPDVIRTDK